MAVQVLSDSSRVLTILIIDDDPAIAGFLAILLSDMGTVVSETSAPAGLALARSTRPDLILLDVVMADMDGFEVCRHLKKDPATASIPVLFVTAGDDEDVEIQALEAGAVDFIAKPLRPALVRARVGTQLALRRHTIQLQELAHLDGLTQIHNRRFFDETAQAEIARHRRQQEPLMIALIDVDHFKRYNDALGHQAGDECLVTVAHALATSTRRPGEVVARYGGEEFAIIIPTGRRDDAAKFGHWICKRISDLQVTHPDSDTLSYVTISVGIVTAVPGKLTSLHDMIALADQALYEAKRSGRNRCVIAFAEFPDTTSLEIHSSSVGE